MGRIAIAYAVMALAVSVAFHDQPSTVNKAVVIIFWPVVVWEALRRAEEATPPAP